MTTLPPIASRGNWLVARRQLLEAEKAAARDALNARRRALPIVAIDVAMDKHYAFDTIEGEASLLGLFEGRRQLIVCHFMFHRDHGEDCPGCTLLADSIGQFAHLHARDSTLALVSHAPLAELQRCRRRMGWQLPWHSSLNSDFSLDFHAAPDETAVPAEDNHSSNAGLFARSLGDHAQGEQLGVSVFLRDGVCVYHRHSSYGRGSELLLAACNQFDLTPSGRDVPDTDSGMDWIRLHDRYDDADESSPSINIPGHAARHCCGESL
jgi:predicted dithiol-disulfide oxidoreductase (DUF899 family)